MLKDSYVFPCIFVYREDSVHVYFPDLDGCTTSGQDEEQALTNAQDALRLHLYSMEQVESPIPKPTKLKDVSLFLNDDEIAILINVFMPIFRAQQKNKYVRKNLTVPYWLNLEAERNGVNFSQVLQDGLKKHLHIKTDS